MSEHIHQYKAMVLGGEKILRTKVPGTNLRKKTLVKTNGAPIFKCMLPGCRHYIARNLAQGLRALCWVCNEPMIMTMESLALTKPRHWACRRGNNKIEENTLHKLAEQMKGI